MDETQKRKLGAKEYIQDHRKFITLSITVFVLFFIILFIMLYLYSFFSGGINSGANSGTTDTSTSTSITNLLPTFTETNVAGNDSGNSLISDFTFNKIGSLLGVTNSLKSDDDTSKLFIIEDRPVSGFTTIDKKISIKNYIKDRPRVCDQKLSVFLQKDTKGKEVTNFQVMMHSLRGFEDTPQTDVLDEETRNKLYLFQKKYAEILYKNKADKEPTRLIDNETVHFLNLLCGFEAENKDDFLTYPNIRYVVKETGEVFDYNTDAKTLTKVQTPDTATSTEEVLFSKNSDFIVLRKQFKGNIETSLMNLKLNKTDRLENNILTADIATEKMIYGIQNGDSLKIKEISLKDEKTRDVASIPLTEWNLKYLDDSSILISLKPTAYAQSISMILDLKTASLKQIIKPTLGLSVQPTEIKDFVVYSDGGKGSMETFLVNTKTKTLGALTIPTIAEKCAKGIFMNGLFCATPKNLDSNYIYPDDYYKNKINTEDILLYKSLSGTTTKIVSYLENKPIDVLDLTVKDSGIFFRDKKTLKLYRLGF